ncbi:MAG: ANTAR domain-containing protein, partial [Treponema sp.]|nr:ANTAR domain-containing protein [Treponema sp.]
LNWLESARERLRQFEKKTISIEDKMAEIRLVNKAKWLLISELKMSEPDAHRYVEKQAMDRCVSRRFIAEEIIKTYS